MKSMIKKSREQSENFDQTTPELPELHEKDECSRCGNLYDSPGDCVECARRPEKKKYQEFGEDREWALAMERAKKSLHGRNEDKKYIAELAKIFYNEAKLRQRKETSKKKTKK